MKYYRISAMTEYFNKYYDFYESDELCYCTYKVFNRAHILISEGGFEFKNKEELQAALSYYAFTLNQ